MVIGTCIYIRNKYMAKNDHLFSLCLPPILNSRMSCNSRRLERAGIVFIKNLAFTFVPVGMRSVFSPGIETTIVCQ